jgi:oligopeptide transport system substrate-binding protein
MMENASEDRGKFPNLTRRQFLGATGASAAGLVLAKNGLLRAGSRTPSVSRNVNAFGVRLPDGAAPASEQFMVNYANPSGQSYKAMDFYESVYSRAPLADQFNVALVRITPNFTIVPGSATHWKQTSPTTWEFYIQPGIMWSDGNELTANDFVETFRYAADPKHAWDFTFYWSGVLKNFTEIVAGKAPVNSLGVAAKSKYTFLVTTEGPIAFIPVAMLYSSPLSAAGLAKYGNGSYNLNPATSITCGPYALKTFSPTSEVVLGPNTKYTGSFKPMIEYQIAKISSADELPLFETGAIDWTGQALTPTDLKIAKSTPRISHITPDRNPQDFRIYYVFFQCTKPPFNNMKVRQAFAHALDRNTIIKALIAPLGTPAYGYLMPGYPFAVSAPLEKYTNYDPELALKLLAEAGYPKGKGFPTITFSYPTNPSGLDPQLAETVVQAVSDGFNTTLFGGNATLLLQQLDTTTFYNKMEAKPDTQLQMGFITYGMDYFDASNMLSVYKSEQQGGRHDWNNTQYDNLLAQGAAAFNHNQRQEIYTEAQTLLTREAPAVFIWHGLYSHLTWPYLTGPALSKNVDGYTGLEWPQFATNSTNQQNLYVANTVSKYPRASESGAL